ncbi:MAG: VanW family protein [Oscillospiraceae bacterium]|jgi:hypothetical protein|nr:VanW family protein [Oscillospiraceae bacterium]
MTFGRCGQALRGLLAALLCVAWSGCCALAFAAPQDAVCFTATVTRALTVRSTMNQAGKRVEQVEKGEQVDILALERDWALIRKGDVEGYIVGKYFADFVVLDEAAPLPNRYKPLTRPAFAPRYTAEVTKKMSVRAETDEAAKLVATLYEGERVQVAQIGPVWSRVRRDKDEEGFTRTDGLANLEMPDPYQALEPGMTVYPYAAIARRDIDIMAAAPLAQGVLQRIPAGAVFPVAAPDEAGLLRLPYLRTVGAVRLEDVELLPVMPGQDALAGDLVGVFSTFFPTAGDRDIDLGRRHNIDLGVSLVNAQTVQPGARFSFNGLAAPYNRENGYQVGPIINYVSDKQTGYGGGVCQVSTTLYNVVLQLPLRVVVRRPHSAYGISYAPVNFDAAVGTGNLNFIFENGLPYPIFIQLDVWEGVVCARIYRAPQGNQPVEAQPVQAPQPQEEALG